MSKGIAALLALFLAAEPGLAQVARVVPAAPIGVSAVGAGAGASIGAAGPRSLSLSDFSLAGPNLAAPLLTPSVSPALGTPAAGIAGSAALPAALIRPSAAPRAAAPAGIAPVRGGPHAGFQKKISAVGRSLRGAARGIKSDDPEAGKAAADRQFDALGDAPSDESFEALLEKNLSDWESGRLGTGLKAPAARELLGGEAPAFTEKQIRRVQRTSDAMERAVAAAAETVMPGAAFKETPERLIKVVSRGSSARGTFDTLDADYDIMVELPGAWSPEELGRVMREGLGGLSAALEAEIRREAGPIIGERDLKVSVGSFVQLHDPVTRAPDEGVYMLPVHVYGPGGALLIDADVTFTNRKKYTNDYPGYFADQIARVAELGGREAVDEVLGSIRLAKRFFKEVVGAYKVWRGGPSGVGVEQMIMQSGRVSDADKGRTVLEPGNFDLFMDRIHDIAFEPDGSPRGLKKARRLWDIHNPFREPENFLDHIGDGAWKRLAAAAMAYRRAKAEGRPLTFADLAARARPAPPAKKTPVEKPLEIRELRAFAVRIETGLNRVKMTKAFKDALKDLRARGVAVLDSSLSWSRAEGKNAYTASVLAEYSEGADEAVRAAIAAKTGPGSTEAVEGRSGPDLILFLAPFGRASDPKSRRAVEKAVKRLNRRLGTGAEARVAPSPGAKGEFTVKVSLRAAADAAAVLETAKAFFKESAAGASLAAAAFPGGSAARTEAASGNEEPGALTLKMLSDFTLSGPKPSDRGDAFLYAQGAKVLPAGYEDAWAKRPGSGVKGMGKASPMRAVLKRKGGRTFILVATVRGDGLPGMKPKDIPEELVQGVIGETLVEVEFAGNRVAAVTPVGSYAMDMMVGRVVNRRGGTLVEPLFSEDGSPKGLYGPLPVAGGASPAPGAIVQVFVRPNGDSFEAVPVLELGTEITPEIAAREIALRHGARGYFDAAVVRQAETVGRTQDAAAEFARLKERMAAESPGRKIEDLSDKPFVTVDPIGAGDLDDAFAIEKHADGSYTWYLATADVAEYAPPGTPAFRTAARIGNTFYSIDKNGVSEYPMNHPVISKSAASLLAGKDSLAMITRMRFGPDGSFVPEESEVYLGKVRVQGRYTYEQVVDLWKGKPEHGIAHGGQIALARELAGKLDESDARRGKLALRFQEFAHTPGTDGSWRTEAVEEDPLLSESHKLIEELKVYGNRGIAEILTKITADFGVPHISRVHPEQEESVNRRLRKELQKIGVRWAEGRSLWDFLNELNAREDLSQEARETAQILALMTRLPAKYAVSDAEGHEGLALAAGAYDHPSTPIRRFADMYNRELLEAYLAGRDPREVYEAVVADLKGMGFTGLEEYMLHLNGREAATKLMDREVDSFMSIYELAKPEHKGRKYRAYVKLLREGRNPMAVIQFRDIPVSVTLRGAEVGDLRLLDAVEATVLGADPARLKADLAVRKTGRIPTTR